MGRFKAKYSDDQRTAAVAAVLDHGESAANVARRAAAGELLETPFAIPAATVRHLVRAERGRRRRDERISVAGDTRFGATLDWAAEAVHADIRRIQRETRGGKPLDHRELRAALRTARELELLTKHGKHERNDRTTPEEPDLSEDNEPSAAEELTREARERAAREEAEALAPFSVATSTGEPPLEPDGLLYAPACEASRARARPNPSDPARGTAPYEAS